ncbi:MAG: hypothetical protein CM1200mP29_12600 [Verrucomicrobiota bacterium]|nr:MAG: hypothetical protein CM1200mP29_12600 [Verrucomicrobiota bacterium]
MGLYKVDMVPGSVGSLAWFYVDGTKAGNEEIETGTIAFEGGMIDEGDYKAVFFENDGYTIFAETPFKVQQAAPDTPQLVSSSPQDGSKNADPAIAFKAVIRNGSTSLNLESVKLSLNNQDVKVDIITSDDGFNTVSFTGEGCLKPVPVTSSRWNSPTTAIR